MIGWKEDDILDSLSQFDSDYVIGCIEVVIVLKLWKLIFH